MRSLLELSDRLGEVPIIYPHGAHTRPRVVPAGKAYEEALALATRLAAGPTRAIRWTKLATNKRLKDEVNLVLDASLAVETLSMATEDHQEAARAFVEKRPPHFTGT